MQENILVDKTRDVVCVILNHCRQIREHHQEQILTRQLIRSATSIIANIQEANAPESRNDFIHKLCIARKELRETLEWIYILNGTKALDSETYCNISSRLSEILKIINASICTARRNVNLSRENL